MRRTISQSTHGLTLGQQRGLNARAEILQARARPQQTMQAGQARGLAVMFARRIGETNPQQLRGDVNRFARASGHNTNVAQNAVPNQHFLGGEVRRVNAMQNAGHTVTVEGLICVR